MSQCEEDLDFILVLYLATLCLSVQTGSGKTHTMLGDIEGGTRRHSADCGMTPRVFEYMFSRIQKVQVNICISNEQLLSMWHILLKHQKFIQYAALWRTSTTVDLFETKLFCF